MLYSSNAEEFRSFPAVHGEKLKKSDMVRKCIHHQLQGWKEDRTWKPVGSYRLAIDGL